MSRNYRIIICIEFLLLFGCMYVIGLIQILNLIMLPFTDWEYFEFPSLLLVIGSTTGFLGMNFSMFSIICNDVLKYKRKILLNSMLLVGVLTVVILFIIMSVNMIHKQPGMLIGFFIIAAPAICFSFHTMWLIMYKLQTKP
ncbi:MAG: hypothetical protein HRU38_24615 [Saccharospirillaceae bacterium]|nr:hypothetical protein [Pseudomonadales bacterium]NRB81804.1 hypothetical protein [Saccharospirillaceae bacterium]